LGLALPIFFQLVIDKVLVHESFTTLYVLAAGAAGALAFDSIFNFLRRYLLLFATNKVDIRVGTKTFGHLLGLPITFFEHSSAGVLVKHMQQAIGIPAPRAATRAHAGPTCGARVACNRLAARIACPLAQMVTVRHESPEVAPSATMLGEGVNQTPEREGKRSGFRPELPGRIACP